LTDWSVIDVHHKRRGFVLLAGVELVFALCLLSACAGSSTEAEEIAVRQSAVESGDSAAAYLSYQEAGAEYEQAVSELDLPPSVVFPSWTFFYADEIGSYEHGCGISAAQCYWRDAWIIEWLEQRGIDAEREAKALDVLKNEVPQSELFTVYSDQNVRDHYHERLGQAELGDPSGFQQFVDANSITVVRAGE
jgi:hypothetical protein